uniref:Putative phytol kinase 2, chloroplastic n=1 Tax=Anthurium amnicola TaxID=1678845 RepID=A0A1D1XNQ1_9ARAE
MAPVLGQLPAAIGRPACFDPRQAPRSPSVARVLRASRLLPTLPSRISPAPAQGRVRRRSTSPRASMWAAQGEVVHDVFAAAITSGVALGLLRFWEELAKRGVFDQKLSRKLVHVSVGLVFMLFWPLFSYGRLAPFLAALAPGINIIRMLLLGLGIWRNDAMVKSMSRHGDYRYG